MQQQDTRQLSGTGNDCHQKAEQHPPSQNSHEQIKWATPPPVGGPTTLGVKGTGYTDAVEGMDFELLSFCVRNRQIFVCNIVYNSNLIVYIPKATLTKYSSHEANQTPEDAKIVGLHQNCTAQTATEMIQKYMNPRPSLPHSNRTRSQRGPPRTSPIPFGRWPSHRSSSTSAVLDSPAGGRGGSASRQKKKYTKREKAYREQVVFVCAVRVLENAAYPLNDKSRAKSRLTEAGTGVETAAGHQTCDCCLLTELLYFTPHTAAYRAERGVTERSTLVSSKMCKIRARNRRKNSPSRSILQI